MKNVNWVKCGTLETRTSEVGEKVNWREKRREGRIAGSTKKQGWELGEGEERRGKERKRESGGRGH